MLMKRCAIVVLACIVVLGCSLIASDRIVGLWRATVFGERVTYVFGEDGSLVIDGHPGWTGSRTDLSLSR
jgi:hypothetical protein